MDRPPLSRELLLADIALTRGLAAAPDVAAALQRYWAVRKEGGETFGQILAKVAEIDAKALAAAEEEVEGLVSKAGGDARRALTKRGRVDRAIELTLGVQPGPRRAADEAGSDQAPVEALRSAPEGRFEDCLIAGEGGMGVIYMAFDKELSRFVALKMIRPALADGSPADTPLSPFDAAPPSQGTAEAGHYNELRQRFLQEAWITGGLEHPGIVPVYELGQTAQGMPFYTMRFVSGHRTLATAISEVKTAGFAERMALLEPFLKICDAVEYAHSRGVVHRDLKPANVALGEYGEVLVLDWGLAKIGADTGDHDHPWVDRVREFRASGDLMTQVSSIGTPGYMAPEAALGEAKEVDAQSDVYSLGAILYETLTGRLPHKVSSLAEWIAAIRSEDVAEPARLDPSIPAGLSAIAAGALSRDKARRPTGAGELADAIRAWQVSDAEARELDRLEREARAALSTAEEAKGDSRLRAAERAGHLLQLVSEGRPESKFVSALLEEVARLRQLGLRERTWQMVRRPLVAAAVLVGAVFLTTHLMERSRRQARVATVEESFETAERMLRAERPANAKTQAGEARTLLEAAERQGDIEADLSESFRLRQLEILCNACVQAGDVEGLAKDSAEALASARSPSERAGFRLAVARAFSQLGLFKTVRSLLEPVPSLSAEGNALLLESYLRTNDRAQAVALAAKTGNQTALSLLRGYAPLRRIPLAKVTGVAVVKMSGGGSRLASVTSEGVLGICNAGLDGFETIDVGEPLRRPGIQSDQVDCVTLSGQHRREGNTRETSVILQVNLKTGAVKRASQDMECGPVCQRIDLDGDGQPESVLLYASEARGVEVLGSDGNFWDAAKLGDLADLSPNLPDRGANVDVHCAILLNEGDLSRRQVLLGTGSWNKERLGFGVQSYRFEGPAKTIRAFKHRRLGIVSGLASVDLDSDGTEELYLWNSYDARADYGSVHSEFALPGVHVLDPETLELSPVRTAASSGFFHSGEDALKTSPVYWTFLPCGQIQLPSGGPGLLTVTNVRGVPATAHRTHLELLFHDDDKTRTWVIPDVLPHSGIHVCTSGDLLPEFKGPELAVVGRDEIVILGERDEVAEPVEDEGAPPRGDGNDVWSLAEGLRSSGYPGLAADLYEAFGFEEGGAEQDAERWLRTAASRLEARQTELARQALRRASKANGVALIEGDCWEARISAEDHRPAEALAAYELAAKALERPQVRADLTRRVGALRAQEIEQEIQEGKARLKPGSKRLLHQTRFDAAALTPAGLPPGWHETRPRLSRSSDDGQGVQVALSGQRGDFVGFTLEVDEPLSFRAWVRLSVEEQDWGSQLTLGFSQGQVLALSAPDRRQDAAWISLQRGDDLPRGIDCGFRVDDVGDLYPANQWNDYLWGWERPLLLEISYHRGLRQIQFLCKDAISGVTLHRIVRPVTEPLAAGAYRVGVWGTPARNPYNRTTRATLSEFGLEVTSDGEQVSRRLPPQARAASWILFKQALKLHEGGETERAAALLTTRVEREQLVRYLVGPRPGDSSALVEACQDQPDGEALTAELKRAMNGTLRLLGLDPHLLVALYLRDRLGALDDAMERTLVRALSRTGHFAERRRFFKKSKRPAAQDLSVQKRLELADAFYDSAADLEAFLRALLDGEVGEVPRCAALKECVFGALARGDEEQARVYLGRLLSRPGLEPESLKDDPALRKLLESR